MIDNKKTPRLKGWSAPWALPTGLFIRDYLKEHDSAYAQEIWRALKLKRKEAEMGCGSYDSFRRNYIYVLRQLGLIEKVSEESPRPEWFNRIYYRIVPGREDDEAWKHPQRALDPRRALGKKRYKKRKR